MATPNPDQRRTGPAVQPAGVDGDGMDAYPTYRDGPVTPHRTSGHKPTDVGLPKARRTYALPIMIGLVVFALVIVIRIVWGGINVARTADEALTPGDTATPPAAAAPASTSAPAVDSQVPEPQGSEAGGEVQGAGPGEVGAEPGAIDVPGGATTDPVEPAPQQ